MTDNQWLNTAVAYLDWVNCGEPYWDDGYAEFKVERAAAFHANVLMLSMQIGGYSVYPSKYADMAPRLNYDLLQRFCELTRKRGMRLVAYWIATAPGAAMQLELHPDWQQRDAKDEPIGCMCYMTPYGRHTLGQVEEVLAGYEVDGLYFDQMPVGCFCSFCQARFQARFNRDLMGFGDVAHAKRAGGLSHLEAEEYGDAAISGFGQIRQFVQENTDWWIGSVRAAIDRLRPAAVYQQGKLWETNLQRYADKIDVVLPEILWWSVGGDPDRLALSRAVCRAYAGDKPVYDCAKYDDTNIDRRCLEEVKLLMANAMTCDALPLLREARVADLAPRRMGDLQEYMGQVRTLVERRAAAEPIISGTLLHSLPAEQKHHKGMGPSISGACRILRENQILADLTIDEGLSADLASRRSFLLVPEYGRMEADVERRLVEYIGAGGNAVVVLGELDSDREFDFDRRPLMRMLGMTFLGLGGTRSSGWCPSLRSVGPIPAWSKRYLNYGEIAGVLPITDDIDQTTFSFLTPYLEASYGDDCRPLVWARDFDHLKANERHFNRRAFWPGERICPIAVLHEGAGRVAFFAAPVFDMDFRRRAVEMDTLLARTVRWAAGQAQEVEVLEGPLTLRMAAYANEAAREYTIMLTNLATNDLAERAIHQVHPSSEIVLKVTPRFDIHEATCLVGPTCAFEAAEESVTVRISSVRFLEGVVLR